MKIEKRSESNKPTFKELKVGDVFKDDVTKGIYMKIKECRVDNDDCTTNDFNALMLSTGDFYYFIDIDEVELIPNATLVY